MKEIDKKLDNFDYNEKKFSFSDIMKMLPTEKECEEFSRRNFGFEMFSDLQEQAFVSGTDWIRWEIERKMKGKK